MGIMIKAQPFVAADKQEAYTDAVDAYITKQQMSSTMAYTSSWRGIENPNGSIEQIEENLLEAKGGDRNEELAQAGRHPARRPRAALAQVRPQRHVDHSAVQMRSSWGLL